MKSKLSWDEYFIALAKVSALRSKDPNTQVGAVIVNDKNRVIALGYNGMPNGNDTDFPWQREADQAKDTKYPYVIHAEMNAILNATTPIEGASLYITHFPCSACAKLIAQTGIKKIIYTNDLYKDTEDGKISKQILKVSKIEIQQINDINLTIN